MNVTTDPASGDQAARHDAQQAHSQPSQPEPPQRGRAQGTGSAGPAPDAAGQKNPYVDFTGYRVRMPASWPTSVRAALPSFRGGIGSIVRTAHMPMDARIGYWVWLIGCVLAIIGWVFSIAAILLDSSYIHRSRRGAHPPAGCTGQANLSINHRYAPDMDIGLRRRKMPLDSAPTSLAVHRFVISASPRRSATFYLSAVRPSSR